MVHVVPDLAHIRVWGAKTVLPSLTWSIEGSFVLFDQAVNDGPALVSRLLKQDAAQIL
jgi:hypothetical protein